MLKKIPSNEINGTKNALFFLSGAPIHQFLPLTWDYYISISRRLVSLKLLVEFSIFVWDFIFLFNKMRGLFDFKPS